MQLLEVELDGGRGGVRLAYRHVVQSKQWQGETGVLLCNGLGSDMTGCEGVLGDTGRCR